MTTIPATILMSQSFAPRISTKNHIMKISMPPEVSLAATKATSSRKTRKMASDFEPKTQSLFVKNAGTQETSGREGDARLSARRGVVSLRFDPIIDPMVLVARADAVIVHLDSAPVSTIVRLAPSVVGAATISALEGGVMVDISLLVGDLPWRDVLFRLREDHLLLGGQGLLVADLCREADKPRDQLFS